jgi:hypothetical protein
MFKYQIEAYYNKQGIAIKHLDVRQTQDLKYHAIFTLVFKSAQECYDYCGSIRNSINKYLVINDEWKIYEFVHQKNRNHNLGFFKHNPDKRDEIVGNVFDEEKSDKESSEESSYEVSVEEDSNDDSVNIEPEEEKEDISEYEKKYNWLVTPDEEVEHRKQIEEIKSLCKWLATPYWERTKEKKIEMNTKLI